MSTDVGLSILGAPGSGRTTLCQHLNDHTYLRACDGRRFRFKAQEADLDSPRLLENSNIILMTFGLDTEYAEYGQWVIRFGRLVRNEYWEQRGAFHIIGTKYNALEPGSEYVKHPGGLTTMITLYTSISSAIIDTLSGSGIEALCCSLANRAHPIGPSIGSRLHKAYERMKSWGLDLVALIFSLSVPPNINHDVRDFASGGKGVSHWVLSHIANFLNKGLLLETHGVGVYETLRRTIVQYNSILGSRASEETRWYPTKGTIHYAPA